MGEFKAGLWIALLFFYFFMFILIVDSTESIQDEYMVNNVDEIQAIASGYICDHPRYQWSLIDLEKSEVRTSEYQLLKCDTSIGVTSNDYCNALGCSVENVTVKKWWEYIIGGGTEYESCEGTINISGVNISTNIFGLKTVEPYTPPTYYKSVTTKANTLCWHPEITLNQTACFLAGCTWTEYDLVSDQATPRSILKTIGNIFSFRYDFGESGNTAVLLNLIFIVLPLLLLILAIYFALPVIH